jgi:hypothetical protein
MSPAEVATPALADPVEEARRLLALAVERDVPIRVLGGVGIALTVAPAELLLPRSYQDIDLITVRGGQAPLTELMVDAGYASDDEFNAVNGHRRLLYHDDVNGRQVDIFVGAFSMCHTIPLQSRMLATAGTLPAPELLLTKLQIVELNPKDLGDILNLVHHHPVRDDDAPGGLNAGRIAAHCAADWGLWRTATMNIERASESVGALVPAAEAQEILRERLEALRATLDSASKTRKWKLRARIGDRVRWYEEPEEVE